MPTAKYQISEGADPSKQKIKKLWNLPDSSTEMEKMYMFEMCVVFNDLGSNRIKRL